MGLRALVLAAFFLGSVPFCFFRPFYGIALWVIVAFVNPHAYIWGATTIPWALLVIVPTTIGTILYVRQGWGGLRERESLLLIALGVWFAITTVVSINTPMFMHHSEDTVVRLSLVTKILIGALVTIPIVNTLEKLRIFMIVIAGCFGLFVVKSFPFIIATGGQFRLYGPPNSMIADNNDFGLALNMTLPLFFFLAQAESERWLKRAFVFLFIATIPAILFTYSRGALIGLVVVGFLMLLRLSMRLRLFLTPVFVLGVLTAMVFAPDSWRDRMGTLNNTSADASAQARLNAWQYSMNLAAEHPLTGGGFATFTHELYVRYAPNSTVEAQTAHSAYFQVLAEHGYTGLFLYLALLVSGFLSAAKIARHARRYGDQTVMHYANMFRFSLVGFAAGAAFLSRAYFDYYFCILACIAILKHVVHQRWNSAEEKAEASEDYEDGHDSVWPPEEVPAL
jgi:probable O-glycosylation ligase (exosortase A-associated)